MTLTAHRAPKINPVPWRDEPQISTERPKLRLVTGGGGIMKEAPKARFGIDIDSTLYDFQTLARETFQKLYEETGDNSLRRGMYVPWDEWRSPADACGIETWMKVITMCHAPEVILQQTPFAGAVDTLQALAAEGYGLTYVSTRSPEAAEATHEWLKKSGFPLGEEISIHCQMDDKRPFIAECQYLIDDRPKTLLEFVYDSSWSQPGREKRKGLSLMYPYNRALTDVPDIYLAPTWVGLASWMVRKDILESTSVTPLGVA
jgi:uncharacterized protein